MGNGVRDVGGVRLVCLGEPKINFGHIFTEKNRASRTYCTAHTFCTLFCGGYGRYMDQDIKSWKKSNLAYAPCIL